MSQGPDTHDEAKEWRRVVSLDRARRLGIVGSFLGLAFGFVVLWLFFYGSALASALGRSGPTVADRILFVGLVLALPALGWLGARWVETRRRLSIALLASVGMVYAISGFPIGIAPAIPLVMAAFLAYRTG